MDSNEERDLIKQLGELQVRECSQHSNMTQDEVKACLLELKEEWFEPGQLVASSDTSMKEVYFLTQGSVEMQTSAKFVTPVTQKSFGVAHILDKETPAVWTLSARSRCKLWRLDRASYQRILLGNSPLDILNQRCGFLEALTDEQVKELAKNAKLITACPGETILRHGAVNTKLYFIRKGEVFGLVRDGGVRTVLSLQRQGEVIRTSTVGNYFGECPFVIEGQTKCSTDSVAGSQGAKLFTIDFSVLSAVIGPNTRIEMRRLFISQTLQSLHDFSTVNTDVIEHTVSKTVTTIVVPSGTDLALADYFHKPLSVLVVTQGVLLFQQKAEYETAMKNLGRLGVGQSCEISSLLGQDIVVTAAEDTCVLLADRPELGTAEEGDTTEEEEEEKQPDTLKRGLSIEIPTCEKKQKLQTKSGFASFRKTRKQQQFLSNLEPLATNPEAKTKTLVAYETPPHAFPNSRADIRFFCGNKTKSPRIRKGNTSPKKRKSGLVLSLSSLEKVDVLGKGAYGTVDLVRHKSSNLVFALKQLNKSKIQSKHQQNRVRSEKSIMEKFGQHPFITNFIRTFRDDQSVYLLLEAGLGGDLFDLIEGKPDQSLTKPETVFFGSQLILALEFLHHHNVVYRDLKPENCILCVDGYLRLTDFGMAKEIENSGHTYTLCGTPAFMAPEILKLGGYGTCIDWWALGILLYEISSGRFPFEANAMKVMRSEHRAYCKTYPSSDIYDSLAPNWAESDRTQWIDLVKTLVDPEPERRALGIPSLKSHPCFDGIDWGALYRRDISPPHSVITCVANSRTLAATNTYNDKREKNNASFGKDVQQFSNYGRWSNAPSSTSSQQEKLWDMIF